MWKIVDKRSRIRQPCCIRIFYFARAFKRFGKNSSNYRWAVTMSTALSLEYWKLAAYEINSQVWLITVQRNCLLIHFEFGLTPNITKFFIFSAIWRIPKQCLITLTTNTFIKFYSRPIFRKYPEIYLWFPELTLTYRIARDTSQLAWDFILSC